MSKPSPETKVYIICPVRQATQKQVEACKIYVAFLEQEFGCQVHYPPRDVDQTNDDNGVRICFEHARYLIDADEVHVYWDETSQGSHFDLGMVFMANMYRTRLGLPRLKVKHFPDNSPQLDAFEKSFAHVLEHMISDNLDRWVSHAVRPTVRPERSQPPKDVDFSKDSGDEYLNYLAEIAQDDIQLLREAQRHYGNSWKSRGGIGAWMMAARKFDRAENRLSKLDKPYDVFFGIFTDTHRDGMIDDIGDLRRYCALIEAEARARGFRPFA